MGKRMVQFGDSWLRRDSIESVNGMKEYNDAHRIRVRITGSDRFWRSEPYDTAKDRDEAMEAFIASLEEA